VGQILLDSFHESLVLAAAAVASRLLLPIRVVLFLKG
jgi:hypothetical protein